MPRIIETTVYTIAELAGPQKEAARAWCRHEGLPDEWYEFVYRDFTTICGILGVTLATTPDRPCTDGTRDRPQIHFQVAYVQGDGASFFGTYSHTGGSARAIRAHAPKDTELHRIADALQAAQRPNFHQLHAYIRQRGRHSHEYSMAIEVERDSPTSQPITDGAEDTVTEALRDLARWLYRRLRSEHEEMTSDESVDENALANDWTFTADGKRFG